MVQHLFARIDVAETEDIAELEWQWTAYFDRIVDDIYAVMIFMH